MTMYRFGVVDRDAEEEITNRYGLGRFNEVPIGWREVTEEEYVKKSLMRSYSPHYMVYKQLRWESEKHLFPVYCYLMHDGTGAAIHYDYWGGRIRYFRFGCQHDYKQLSPAECKEKGIAHHGRNWHVNECANCHYVDSYDSGD